MPGISKEPLSDLAEVKKFLSIGQTIDEHDEDLERLIKAIREEAERLTGIPIVRRTVTLWLDAWPSSMKQEPWWDGIRDGWIGDLGGTREIELPPGNLRNVTAVNIYDEDDTEEEISTDIYQVDKVRNRLALRTSYVWPTSGSTVTSLRSANGIAIVMDMGWDPDEVPLDLKARMKERLQQRWRARADAALEVHIDRMFYSPWVQLSFGKRYEDGIVNSVES